MLSRYHLVEPIHPLKERVPRFYSWVSTYYTHSDLARRTHDPTLLDTTPMWYPTPPCDARRDLHRCARGRLVARLDPGL
ncbi:hypothetical protein BC827DRAFT_524419 [Russula dissimulans]|nr:hypothetical protein BC827DRAFT_524419 [Russula dissimulans]